MRRLAGCSVGPVLAALTLLTVFSSPLEAHLSIIRQAFEIPGTSLEADDQLGAAVAVGDFNGDGYDDVAMGSPGENLSAGNDAGAVMVCFGSEFGITHVGAKVITAASLGMIGQAGAYFGAALAAGDFNGDGKADLAIGAPFKDLLQGLDTGTIYVTLGGSSFGTAGIQYWQTKFGLETEEDGDHFGASLAVGNFNSDQFQDLAIGIPGEDSHAGAVYVARGGASYGVDSTGALLLRQSSLGGANESGDEFGYALAAGNLFGTTPDDLVVGSPGEGESFYSESGAVWVIRGSNLGGSILSTFSPALLTPANFGTAQSGARFGSALAVGQFFDGTFRSLAIGEPYRTVGGLDDAGQVVVVEGGISGFDLANAKVLTENSGPGVNQVGDRFGEVLAAGDYYNPDGYDDVAIGAPMDGLGAAPEAGAFFIYPGAANGPTGVGWSGFNQGTCNEPFEGGDRFGSAIAFGRFDESNRGGFAVGAPREDYEELYLNTSPTLLVNSGQVHVIAPWRQVFGLSSLRSVVYDCDGNLIFSQKPFDVLNTASTAQIMTVLLACERSQLSPSDPLYRSLSHPYLVQNWTFPGTSSLLSGETITLKDLLYVCLLTTGNDAAFAIADVVYGGGGSDIEDVNPYFVSLMNARAANLGMVRTHFNSPAGLDTLGPGINPNHSSPEDMAKLSRAAMANSLFREIADAQQYTWLRDPPTGQSYLMTVSNVIAGLIGLPGVNGITGGWSGLAKATGCFSAKKLLEADVIAGHYTTPNPPSLDSFVPDAVQLLTLGLNGCPARYQPLGNLGPFKFTVANISTELDVRSGGSSGFQGQSAEDVPFDLMRQVEDGRTPSLDLEVGRQSETSLPYNVITGYGIAPFRAHKPIEIWNRGTVARRIRVVLSYLPGSSTTYTMLPNQVVIIPAHTSPSLLSDFTMELTSIDVGSPPATLEVKETYTHDLNDLDAGVGQPLFRCTMKRRGIIGQDSFQFLTTGQDSPAEATQLFAAAHDTSLSTVGVGDPIGPLPGESAMHSHRATPNPFHEGTRITFELTRTAEVTLSIHDVQGRQVHRERPYTLTAGRWGFDWDGRGLGGEALRNGVYFYRLAVDGREVGSGRITKLQ